MLAHCARYLPITMKHVLFLGALKSSVLVQFKASEIESSSTLSQQLDSVFSDQWQIPP